MMAAWGRPCNGCHLHLTFSTWASHYITGIPHVQCQRVN